MGWYVIVGTLPIGILGFLFRDLIEGPARNLWLVATMLVVSASSSVWSTRWRATRSRSRG